MNTLEKEQALAAHGYKIGPRDPNVNPEFPGAYMITDPLDGEDGYALVGDSREELIEEAHENLLEFCPMKQEKPTCPHCGGANVTADAICTWNMAQQVWEYQELTDSYFCATCEETLKWVEMVEVENG